MILKLSIYCSQPFLRSRDRFTQMTVSAYANVYRPAMADKRDDKTLVIARQMSRRSNPCWPFNCRHFNFQDLMMPKTYYVYILTNKRNRVLYTGITNDLISRVHQHREKTVEGFSARYNVNRLVYFEAHNNPREAIEREKQIKAGSRIKKIRLIERNNPGWEDLYTEIASLG